MAETNKDLYFGLIHLHLLDYACREPLLGAEAVRKLKLQGYRLPEDTIYDLLHLMEKRGWLRSRTDYNGGRGGRRRVYITTSTGKRALDVTRPQVKLLFDQLFKGLSKSSASSEDCSSPTLS